MIRIVLSDRDTGRLEQAFLPTSDRQLRDRLQIVRLAPRGRPHPDIAADLGVPPRTVPRWLNADLERGLDGLRPRKARGREPAIPAHLAAASRRGVIEGPAAQGLDRANGTHAERADHLKTTHGITARRSAMPRFGRPHAIRPSRPTYRHLRGDPVEPAEAVADLAALRTKAESGALVLRSQDAARFPMVPTRGATLGVKGHRPMVGTRDHQARRDVFAVGHVVTAAVHANLRESPARAQQTTGKRKTRRMQEAVAAPLRPVARIDPAPEHKRVVRIIDNAPWHRGQPIDAARAEHPHREVYRRPRSSPHRNAIARFWRVRRRRATPHRLFDPWADVKRSLRSSLCDFQTVRGRVRSRVAKGDTRPADRKASAGS